MTSHVHNKYVTYKSNDYNVLHVSDKESIGLWIKNMPGYCLYYMHTKKKNQSKHLDVYNFCVSKKRRSNIV